MFSETNYNELEEKGYTVVNDVLTTEECNQAIEDFKRWLQYFDGKFPNTYNSIIKNHNSGHFEVTWRLRLKAKPVFAQLWKTDKLLTSFDAISIGRPPEDGAEEFQDVNKYWLHADTTPSKLGLHAYQGALYLEEQTESDWTFQVMEGSHKHLVDLFSNHLNAAKEAKECGCHVDMTKDDVDFFTERGCKVKRVPVQKGGMVLWDSRLIHANARPLKNRKHGGRWRYVTFISMTPAIWANEEDLKIHKEAYQKPTLTTHWSSQGVRLLESQRSPGIPYPDTVPDIARTDEAMKLSGVLPYDFNDGQPNGDEFIPIWKPYDKVKIEPELDNEVKFANGHI
ncbi:hypothetical protein ACF0H5_002237 [Mactra antiquata]